ncbi:nitroreductase/quinone reductase family protein [Nocardia alni]|uniref:nitroreductase/quinone reductase family protein n=1 Tax=Nocardia alni TaxID=2815723 RepID=UPI001C24CAFD|nr:nitroreductase/quinone reductase family protein [Nocardia alni]
MATQFPDRQWGSRTHPISRLTSRFAATRVGSLVVRVLSPLDRRVLERTAGRYTALGPIGAPIIALTTTGRLSGQPRTTPLLYVHGGDVLYVIGSNFGQSHHPAWTANLLADPQAIVTITGERIPVRAEVLADPESKARIFGRFVEISEAYAAYRTRTTRDLRIFTLTRD